MIFDSKYTMETSDGSKEKQPMGIKNEKLNNHFVKLQALFLDYDQLNLFSIGLYIWSFNQRNKTIGLRDLLGLPATEFLHIPAL